ncbi:hypothetical protein NWFMUON74_01700 [Nocardia wallacei]|uniref:Uncharacterized protein n=1 Tax=Nocardia wallacei TaxID=480035 RepID=A0A7G1KB48_9NOCA|nr:hypothetical protein NWFMUON74_01700 [Nocardia wallacei]
MSEGDTKREAPLLQWPAEWGKERLPGKLIAALIILVLIILISIPYTLDYIGKGEPMRAAFGAAGGLMGLSLLIVFIPRLRVRRTNIPPNLKTGAIDDHGAGLRADVQPSWRPLLFVWLALGAAFLVLRGILFATDMSENENSARAGLDAGGLIIVVVVLAMIAFIVFYLLAGRGKRYFLAISEYGISQGLGHTTRTLSWSDVGAVQPILLNSNHTVRIVPIPGAKIHVDTGKSLVDRMQRGLLEGSIDVPVAALGIDPALALHLVRYYWQHPEARGELTSAAAVDRMRRGDLVS